MAGRVLVVASPGLLIALGLYGTLNGGWGGPGPWLLTVGLVTLTAAALLQPWESIIGPEGISCRTLARRRRIAWNDAVSFERERRRRGRDGPLVVRTVERRRIPLTDRVERPDEWDSLRALVARHGPGIALPEPPHRRPRTGPR